MARWRDWLRCIGEAVVAKGLRALVAPIPLVGLIWDVAVDAIERIKREEPAENDRRASLQALVQAPAQEVQQEALAVARLAAPDQPPEVQQQLAGYLMQVPAVARQSLRRADDPTGTTVPPQRGLSWPEDLLPVLPARVPRFKAGDRPPGIGDWELVQLLGVGGFGEVWKARNPHFDGVPPVALKFCLDPAAKDRLLRHEAAVLNQVMRQGKHPGIVALQHTYLSADPPCLGYEYVAGGDLAGAIQRWHHKAPADLVGRVTRAMLGLADIIAFAHRLEPPIVHRDLKPANILLQPQDGGGYSLRVADFGIGGVAANEAIVQTRTGLTQAAYLGTALRGSYTPLYASPQQMGGDPPDPRDDVHALGVIWLQMLTGDLTRGAVPDWRDELDERGVPEPVLQVLAKCPASRGERRLASAVLLRDELSRLAQPGPAVVSPVISPPPRPRPRAPAAAPLAAAAPAVALPAASPAPPAESARSISNSIGMKLVLIPAGKFLMGSPQTDRSRSDDEHQHEVEITEAFYLGQYPVTKGQFAAFVKATGHPNPGAGETDQHPVVEVDWKDAVAFCDWLSEKERKEYRLPTEAEWEYSCRAGTTTAYSFGDHPKKLKAYAWYNKNAGGAAHKVGAKKPNPWGLYDMQGNVCEWCEDWYDEDYYQKSPGQNPQGPSAGTSRVVRGGSFFYFEWDCRAAARTDIAPSCRARVFGFRVVRAR
jgi:formylglycine-generating enzyme required for sulfatase activity